MLSHTEYSLRTIDCEFTFDECNNFCEKDTLKTLVTETFASEEKEVKTHPLQGDFPVVICLVFYKTEQLPRIFCRAYNNSVTNLEGSIGFPDFSFIYEITNLFFALVIAT